MQLFLIVIRKIVVVLLEYIYSYFLHALNEFELIRRVHRYDSERLFDSARRYST